MLRTVAHRRDSPQLRALLIKKVERRNVQFEELRHLAQGTMQRIAEVERFRQRLGDRIQHQEFAVAPPYFMLGLLPLGDVENKSLRRGNKHALLYARNEGPVFLFRALPVGDVL